MKKFGLKSDEQFVYDLLCDQKVLVVPGTGFNYGSDDHFRIVILPTIDELNQAMDKIEFFLENRRVLSTKTVEEIIA